MTDAPEAMDVDELQSVPSVSRLFNPDEFGLIEIPDAPQTVATYDANGPRLIITQIVNENFKSYAGQQTLGPFHKCFTSIIGPNGSGKSNVIDSMLFVFGYRASKIRSKKISVLIHNSENHKNINSCTVAVYFQKIVDTGPGEDDYTVVPDSKFVVSRTANKDNSSSYTIDGKRATYKEVAKFLRGSGIDLDHNRFLILQGEVEQIAMMKPKALTEHEDGMLEFLEDIIGSNRFKEPITVLTTRVENLGEMRAEKLNRVKAVEKEVNDLEGSKNEAVEYLTMENSISKFKNKLYQKYIGECTVNEQKATADYSKIAESMKEVNTKLEEINDQKKEKGKDHKQVYKEYEALVKLCEDTKNDFTEFERQDVKCREDFKHAKIKAKKLVKTLEQEKSKIEELKAVPEENESAIETMKKKQEGLEEDKTAEEVKLKQVMDSLKTETKGLQEEKDEKEEKLLAMQKNVNETKSKLHVAQSKMDIYLSNQQKETKKLEDLQKKLDKAEETVKQRTSGLTELEQNGPEVEKQLHKCRKELETVTANENNYAKEMNTLRGKVEDGRNSRNSAKRQGRVLDALLAQKNSGKIPGICDRLGNLGAIDEKYDVAISTACGALDHIVVDSIDTAQKCVEFLKKSNTGSATFIGLEKMKRWIEHTKRKITTPENVPRLFDCIRTDNATMLPAFYFALRDTLVAKDLDQATRIAYGRTRYRVVTLQGQLIDTSGTMSGGGSSVSRGRMGSSLASDVIDPKELANMENTLEKLVTEARIARERKYDLDDKIRQNEKDLTNLKHNHKKYEMEIKAVSDQATMLKSQIKEQQTAVKLAAPDKNELDDMERTVQEYTKEFDKVNGAASKIEAEVKQLHQQIMDIGGSKLHAVQKRVDAVNSQIDQVMGQITKAKVGVKTAERNLKKAEDKVASVVEDIDENKNKLIELEKQSKQLEDDATKVLEAHQQSQSQMKVVETSLNKIKVDLGKLEEEENTLNKETIEVKHELDRFDNIIKSNLSKINHWKKELGRLSLNKLEGMESTELETVAADELATIKKEDVQYEITLLEEKIGQIKPNMAAIAEYRKKEELYLNRVGELDQITEVRDKQRKYHEELRKQRLDEFMSGFSSITNKLKEMYQMITLGGDAELELVDSLDPFSEGIVFSVRPPKKSWKNISNLSGGEKTLSSLALVFALHHYKPTPLYVMDEIDAALDFKNVSIVANYIKERTKNAQFIIISLRNNMFELADRLVGIYKTDNCTKSVTINPAKLTHPLQEVIA